MVDSDEDLGRSRRHGTDGWGWSSIGRVLSGQAIESSDGTVCGLYRAHLDEECGFLG
jgi:hypothetical protein